jgi:pimeloyl-ACP methyl ester carboxylesterase
MTANGFESKFVEANGQRLHYVEAGEGPLVLLLHGFPESSYSWRHQIPALAQAGYHAVAIDQRGYGKSSKPSAVEDYAITELVGDCAAVVDALGESTAFVVGHDWGGAIAWTCAVTQPDRFKGVAALSVPYGGRGLVALPGDPFGEDRKPSEDGRQIAGDGLLFYQEYFNLPGAVEKEAEAAGLRKFLSAFYYGASADAPLPDELAGVDLTKLSNEVIVQILRAAMCVPEGGGVLDVLQAPDAVPSFLTEADLDFYVKEFTESGLTGGLNYYRNLDRDWELLEEYQFATIDQPSLFIGGDRDIVTIWSREARDRAPEILTDPRDNVILANCGHWIQQERPQETSEALLRFLAEIE